MQGNRRPEIVQVYEKIAEGIWCDQGRYDLIGAVMVFDGERNVFRFFLRPAETPHAGKLYLRQTRVIPTAVKVALRLLIRPPAPVTDRVSCTLTQLHTGGAQAEHAQQDGAGDGNNCGC